MENNDMIKYNNMNRRSKYLGVADEISQRIEDDKIGPRLPTVDLLSNEYNVTRVTMQKALGILKYRGLVRAIPGQGIFISRLKRPRMHTLGIVLPSQASPLGSALSSGSQQKASQLKHNLIVESIVNDFDLELARVKKLVENNSVDGLVLWLQKMMDESVAYLKEEKIPFVILPEPDIGRFSDCHTVSNHDSHGTSDVMTYLIGLGHKKIGFFCSDEKCSSADWFIHRYGKYRHSLSLASLEELPLLYIDGAKKREAAALQLLRKCTAVFCPRDIDAVQVYKLCAKKGIRIPGDLALVGYDNTDVSKMLGFSSVEQNFSKMGEMAVEILIDEIEGRLEKPKHIYVESKLVIRG